MSRAVEAPERRTPRADGSAWRRVPGRTALLYVAWVIAAAVLLAAGSAAAIARPLVFLPPVALNLGLAFAFGRTLRHGREPLISTFARLERGTLEPDLAAYTRSLTVGWVGFFVGAAALSAALAFATPFAVWGGFVAVGNPFAVAAFFLGEFAFRKRRFPQYRHASPLALARLVAARWRSSADET